jgi:ribosomal protein S12 methylthiotransferase
LTRARHGKYRASRTHRFYIASLGCPKNTVDANAMAVLLQRAGHEPTLSAHEADLIVVNTCGFIEQARAESLEALKELADALTPSQRLVAAGCWAQRDPEKIREAVPRVDALLGTRSWPGIVSLATSLWSTSRALSPPEASSLSLIEDRLAILPEEVDAPGYVISGPSAFLKISEGCSRHCAFCAIPSIKGAAVSRDPDAILTDVRQLRDYGVLEINLIAQDVTTYGADRGMRDGLSRLLERLAEQVPEIPWLRMLYTFPGYITPRLIAAIRDRPQVLPYVDIPLQHAHPDVLRRMRRPADMAQVRATLEALREAIPEVVLRTTLIVGFPGETEEEFETLLDFVEEVQFERLGVFTYSHELGTPAAEMDDDVPEEVKTARYDQVMIAQQGISYRQNQALVGRRLEVLLEGAGDGMTVGRSYRDAPEIDGLVLIREEVPPHRIVTVEVTEALPYDVTGRIV